MVLDSCLLILLKNRIGYWTLNFELWTKILERQFTKLHYTGKENSAGIDIQLKIWFSALRRYFLISLGPCQKWIRWVYLERPDFHSIVEFDVNAGIEAKNSSFTILFKQLIFNYLSLWISLNESKNRLSFLYFLS